MVNLVRSQARKFRAPQSALCAEDIRSPAVGDQSSGSPGYARGLKHFLGEFIE
jgi:hypothetical protein